MTLRIVHNKKSKSREMDATQQQVWNEIKETLEDACLRKAGFKVPPKNPYVKHKTA